MLQGGGNASVEDEAAHFPVAPAWDDGAKPRTHHRVLTSHMRSQSHRHTVRHSSIELLGCAGVHKTVTNREQAHSLKKQHHISVTLVYQITLPRIF